VEGILIAAMGRTVQAFKNEFTSFLDKTRRQHKLKWIHLSPFRVGDSP